MRRFLQLLLFAVSMASLPCARSATPQASDTEVRLWFGEVRLRGPLDEVRFDCGEDGSLRLLAHLVVGEERVLELPFPVRSPLGAQGLGEVPGPRVERIDVPAGGPGSGEVAWIGWSPVQPQDRRAGGEASLRGRPRPPTVRLEVRAGFGLAALLLAAYLLQLSAVRRPWAALAIGILAALGLGALAGSRRAPADGNRVVEVDLDAAEAREIRAAGETLVLEVGDLEPGRAPRLERAPGLGEVHLELEPASGGLGGTVRAPGGSLWLSRAIPAPALDSGENGWRRLAASWTRGEDGLWRSHGAWEEGSGLPAPEAEEATAGGPPGWLAAGLPPGRGVLLGQLAGAGGARSWVRVLGFRVGGP